MVEVLREHGGTLTRVEAYGSGGEQLFWFAVRAGALPNVTCLRCMRLVPANPIHREILWGGMLRRLERLEVSSHPADLGPLRCCPHLRLLDLKYDDVPEAGSRPPFIPPFIPASLKSLILDIRHVATFESLLCELPFMLQASGAALEEIQITTGLPWSAVFSAEGGAALAQVLRTCASSLKTFRLKAHTRESSGCIRHLETGLMSCCGTLEVLDCSWEVFTALPANCPSFTRLTRLVLDWPRGLTWDVIASGRVPALATLSVQVSREMVVGEGGGVLARALASVRGTLRGLVLSSFRAGDLPAGADELPAGASYELGAAIGKLRRLSSLYLYGLFTDGRDYHAVGQGMAASGGCPELFEVRLTGVKTNHDWLTYKPGLIVPSVRDLHIEGSATEEDALLLGCGLVQAGYQRGLVVVYLRQKDNKPLSSSVLACVKAIVWDSNRLAGVYSH
jgi:hypothetical protein